MRCLVIRMSSLGDLILSTSFLENLPPGTQVDWIVASEFQFVLEGHPQIDHLVSFQKKMGFLAWLKLVKKMSSENYDFRVDLHRTLRSRIAMLLFRFFDIVNFRYTPQASISKERLKTFVYLSLKSFTPKILRPTPYWLRFAKLAKSIQKNKNSKFSPPSYLPLLKTDLASDEVILKTYGLESKKFYALMPASRWRSKEWGASHYLKLIELLSKSGLMPLLMGRKTDPGCMELQNLLLEKKISFKSALEEKNFKHSAILLKHAAFYLGSDTGLSHLAEAVGTQSHVLFGPTRADLGFGPWRPESKAITHSVFCSPCSKDGKVCYRFYDPYACLTQLEPEEVRKSLPC